LGDPFELSFGHLGDPLEHWALGRSTGTAGDPLVHKAFGQLDPRESSPAIPWGTDWACKRRCAGLATNYRPRDPFERWAVDPQSTERWAVDPQFTGALLPSRHHWTPPSSSYISAFWLVRSLGMSTLSGSHVRSYIAWFPEALPAGVNSILLLSVSASFGRWEVSRTEYFFLEN
jgi:hypothetical protein